MTKEFNKQLMLDNIYYLLKRYEKKIGELETEAGVSPGYISRISKEDNAKPGIEFIIKVADSLNISVDTLLNVNFTEMTPTEKYLASFLEKLNEDTLDDKLDWDKESSELLNRMEPDENGHLYHPLMSLETFNEDSGCEYPSKVSRIVFVSETFGCQTYINGDCFNLTLKNGAILYFMNISKSAHRKSETDIYAKEIWMYTPTIDANYLCSNKDESQLAVLVDKLYATVSERMKYPQIKTGVKFIIDSFMDDDIDDDEDFEEILPF